MKKILALGTLTVLVGGTLAAGTAKASAMTMLVVMGSAHGGNAAQTYITQHKNPVKLMKLELIEPAAGSE